MRNILSLLISVLVIAISEQPLILIAQSTAFTDNEALRKREAELRNSAPEWRWGVHTENQTLHPHGMLLLAESLFETKPGKSLAIYPYDLNLSNEVFNLEFRVKGRIVSYSAENGLFSYSLVMDKEDYTLAKCRLEVKDTGQPATCYLLLKKMKLMQYDGNYLSEPKSRPISILIAKGKFLKKPSVALLERIMSEDEKTLGTGKSDAPLKLHPLGIQLFYGNIADGSYVHMIANETVNSSKEAAALKTFDRDGWTGYESEDGVFKHRVIREIGGSFYIVECADLPYRASGSFGNYMLIKRAKWRFYEDETPKDLDVLICLGSSHDAPADETIDAIVKSCGLSPQGTPKADGGK